MLKKVITLVTVIAVVGLLSVAAAFASERTRVRDDVVQDSAGLQIMGAAQLQAQDQATGGDAARIRTGEYVQVKAQVQSSSVDPLMEQERNQERQMIHDPECLDCEEPARIQDRDRDRIHQDSVGNAGPNGAQACDGTGPNGSPGSGESRGGKS